MIQSGALANVYRSADQGTTWTALGVPSPAIFPGKSPQGSSQGAIVADKTNPNAVWMSGDRQPDQTEDGSNGTNQFPNTLGADGYWGNIWRNAAGTWENMAADGANGTAPHADSRAMLFNADGEIVHSCDGGIFKLNNPNGTSAPDKSGNRKWSSLNGDLRIIEAHNAVFDPVAKVFMCGAQDNGVNIQQATGSKIWTGYIGGDGGRVEVDADQTAHAGTSIRYGSSQNFGGFNRRSFDANNAPVGEATYAKLMITAGPGAGQSLTQFDKVLFLQPFVLNQINPSRMLIGTEYIFESADMGESLTNLGKAAPDTALKHAVHSAAGATRKSSGAMPSVAVRPLEDEEPPADAGVAVGDDTNSGSAAMAYGGRLQGAAFPDVFYVGAGNKIAHRVTLGGAITSLSYPGDVVRVLVMDPQNYKRVFVLDKVGKVYLTNDEGATWSNITANLGTLTTDLRTIEIFNSDQSGQKTVLYAGGLGGVWKMANPGETGNWTAENGGLPKAVLVYDLRYDYATNTLTAATLGRGVYALTGAAGSVANISTRLSIGRGDNLLITGFIVTGPTGSTKKVLVRGIGPSTNIDGALADPTLELFNAGVVVAQNDNWKTTQTGGLITSDQSGEIQATGAAPKNDAESAMIVTLAPGAYPAQVRGAGDTVGIGIAEAYDLSIASGAQLANVSTRGNVQTENNIMIGGFIVVNNSVKVIVRALGPSLGIDGALADPTLEVRSEMERSSS